MATEKQIRANQQNAQHSTGPSEAGKEASSQNHLKHGLTCHTGRFFIVLQDEDPEEFIALAQDLHNQYLPQDPTEVLLVRRMAESDWLRARAMRFQTHCLTAGKPWETNPQLALFLRYQSNHEKAFYKALNELEKRRAERRKVEIGFESQKRQQAAEVRQSASLHLHCDVLNFKRDELDFKKQVFASKNAPQITPETGPDGLKKVA